MNDLMNLPKCPVHKTSMAIRKPTTKEQEYCGAWYDCQESGCNCTTLIMSKELKDVYKK